MVSGGILPFKKDVAQISGKIPCLPDYFPKKVTDVLVKMLHKNSDCRPDIKSARWWFESFLKDSDTKKKFRTSWKQYKASLVELQITNYEYKFLEDVILTISESESSSETSSSEDQMVN